MSVDNIESIIKNIEQELKLVKKELKKIKSNSKKIEKKEQKNNGLTKEYLLSDELCDFLNIEKNSRRSRSEVTRRLLEYVKNNKLGNKREIKVDERLKKIIKEEKVTYFTIQKSMNRHFKYKKLY